ncbi:M14 family metallopeptidase [Nakamurella lactea]|uniref:M14 family metallopeptidase n=1 Tax=Nakamurella lactea TaxID=459515 RepID=UPI001376A7D9|nr:M14 metallopeptidase family protein [Nakamurella lactea]
MKRRTRNLLVAVPTAVALLAAMPTGAGARSPVGVELLGAAAPTPDPPEAGVPTPESVLGWKPCTDYKLSNYTELTNYFQQLDNASSRMKMVNIGKTSEGRDQYMGLISAPENLTPENLEKYRQISERLSQAKGLTEQQATDLAAGGKAIAWIDFGIHSTEVAPTQTAPQLAYDLLTSESDEAKSIRQNVITLFVPNVNPDGTEHISDWYMKYINTKFADTSYPGLYQKYSGHDDNRDWFMFNLQETKNQGDVLFKSWYPQLVYNTHQTAAYPARIFVPPFKDPSNPNIPAEVIRGINAVGDQMTQRLDREGKVGAISRQQYDQWWNGGLRSVPAFHNQIGILTETAHASATPKYEDPTKFPKTFPYQGVSTSEPSAFYPSPYQGGWWHLSDSCAYIESTAWAYLHTADVDRENWLLGSWRMGDAAIKAGGNTAYVIPADQADFATATKMINVLRQGQVEVEQAKSAFSVGGKTYPAGSFIIREAQPYRANVVDLLNPQIYPDRRNPDGSPERPYDMAGWTLPMQMGVTMDKVNQAFLVNSTPVDVASVPTSTMPTGTPGYAFAIDPRQNDAFTAVTALLKAGETVTRSKAAIETSAGEWPAGTFLVQVRSGAENRVKAQAKKLGLTVAGVDTAPAKSVAVTQPRVGLYQSARGNSDEGWTRYVLEDFKLPYKSLKDKQLRAGDLNSKFDVIVLPDSSYSSMLNGIKAGTYPAAYTGGMTEAGVANLKAFVDNGGKLITVNDAAELPIKAFGLPVKDLTAGVSSSAYYSPGSVVSATVNVNNPLTWGMPAKADIYSSTSPAFQLTDAAPAGSQTPVKYAKTDVLRSGWLLGEDLIAGQPDVVRVPQGKGDVVLLGMSVQHRAQAHGTYKLLFNSLFLS